MAKVDQDMVAALMAEQNKLVTRLREVEAALAQAQLLATRDTDYTPDAIARIRAAVQAVLAGTGRVA